MIDSDPLAFKVSRDKATVTMLGVWFHAHYAHSFLGAYNEQFSDSFSERFGSHMPLVATLSIAAKLFAQPNVIDTVFR